MKTINYKSEAETEKAVIDFTIKGVKFIVTGRKQIVLP